MAATYAACITFSLGLWGVIRHNAGHFYPRLSSQDLEGLSATPGTSACLTLTCACECQVDSSLAAMKTATTGSSSVTGESAGVFPKMEEK